MDEHKEENQMRFIKTVSIVTGCTPEEALIFHKQILDFAATTTLPVRTIEFDALYFVNNGFSCIRTMELLQKCSDIFHADQYNAFRSLSHVFGISKAFEKGKKYDYLTGR